LLVFLPWQLRGELPYHVATFRYIESIFIWSLLFVAFMAMSRRAWWTKPIFVFLGIEMVASSAFGLWRGRVAVATFLMVLLAVCLFLSYVWIVSPPIRSRAEEGHE
jgi:hypothetical protein